MLHAAQLCVLNWRQEQSARNFELLLRLGTTPEPHQSLSPFEVQAALVERIFCGFFELYQHQVGAVFGNQGLTPEFKGAANCGLLRWTKSNFVIVPTRSPLASNIRPIHNSSAGNPRCCWQHSQSIRGHRSGYGARHRCGRGPARRDRRQETANARSHWPQPFVSLSRPHGRLCRR